MQRYLFLLVFTTLLTYSCQENFENRIQREAAEYTQRHCPYPVEPGNRLDSITYDASSRTLIRWYTFFDQMDTQHVRTTTARHRDEVRQVLLTELRGDTHWQACKDQEVNFEYVYRSQSQGSEIVRITLKPNDYRY